MKYKKTFMWLLLSLLVLTGCGSSRPVTTEQTEQTENIDEGRIVVGFSQLGAESDWRSENTESMKKAFSIGNGYTLVFNDGQQKQTNQITAIRTFIQQDVDYIISRMDPDTPEGGYLYAAVLKAMLNGDFSDRLKAGFSIPEARAARRAYGRYLAFKTGSTGNTGVVIPDPDEPETQDPDDSNADN